MCCKMLFIFVYPVLLLGANGEDPICSELSGSSCPPVTTASVNGSCYLNDMLYGDGDVIDSVVGRLDCNGCQQRVCQEGQVLWQPCKECTVQKYRMLTKTGVQSCRFGSDTYHQDQYIKDACARLKCDGKTGLFIYEGLEDSCKRCNAVLDPHIYTYNEPRKSYEYQDCGTYSLSQHGSSYSPHMAVFASFERCDASAHVSCVGTVTFKNDAGTIITIGYDKVVKDLIIKLNGGNIVIPSSSSYNFQPINTANSVLAWRNSICVIFLGSGGFFVAFCGSDSGANSVFVWANADEKGLMGLCGSTTIGNPDYDFTARNGHPYGPWTEDAPVAFVKSWLTHSTATSKCNGFGRRRKRQTQNRCEANSSALHDLQNQCESTVSNEISNSDKLAQGLIDDCVYDLCNVSNPNEWIKAVQEAAQIEANITKGIYNCNCTRWCWKKSGYCTKLPENCDGRVTNRGCDGLGCSCCIPGCRNKKKRCYLKGGFCTTSPETCAGNTTTGCKGQDCECCLEPDRCIPKKKCWRHGGSCIPSDNFCDGKRIENACNSPHCYCCVNHPMC